MFVQGILFFFFFGGPCAWPGMESLYLKAHTHTHTVEYPYTRDTASLLSAPLSRCHVAWLDACPFEIRRQLGMAAQRTSGTAEMDRGKSRGREKKTGCQMRQRAERRMERGGEGVR